MIRNYRVVWVVGPDLSWYGKTHGPSVKSPNHQRRRDRLLFSVS